LPDLLTPETFVDYFGRLHAAKGNLLDFHGIQPLREALKFEQVAEKTRLVDSPAEPVFVPYDEKARKAIDALRWGGPSRKTLRRLQPYTVNLFPNQLKAIQAEGALETVHDFRVLVSDIHYHPYFGLRTQADAVNALLC
jgi:CRISPR-associated endonuclease/helicase Cas3